MVRMIERDPPFELVSPLFMHLCLTEHLGLFALASWFGFLFSSSFFFSFFFLGLPRFAMAQNMQRHYLHVSAVCSFFSPQSGLFFCLDAAIFVQAVNASKKLEKKSGFSSGRTDFLRGLPLLVDLFMGQWPIVFIGDFLSQLSNGLKSV